MNTNLIPHFVAAAFAVGGAYATYLQNAKVKLTILKPKVAAVTVIRGGHDGDFPSDFKDAA
jgi:hypothetical protein